MSAATAMLWPDEFGDDGTNGAARKEKTKKTAGRSKPKAEQSLFQQAAQSEFMHRVLELLAAVWAKVLELEQNLILTLDRLQGVQHGIEASPLPDQEFYTSEEFARRVGLKLTTVQTYARDGKLLGFKTLSGRGKTGEWRFSHEEYLRYKAEGLIRKGGPRPPRQSLR